MSTNIRLGYACINTKLKSPNRSCIQKTFLEKGASHAIELAKLNLESVIEIIQWNEKHNIKLYRMSSDMFPHITNPKVKTNSNDLFSYSLETFQPHFQRIGELSRKYNHRLTFHPGQFNQVGAVSRDVFEKTKVELSYHAEVLDRCGLDPDSIMIVHGGGIYNDKEGTKKRWVDQFFQLPEIVQNRLVIENCERAYSVEDVLEISKQIKRPVVFDTHHHDCHCKLKPISSFFSGHIISNNTWEPTKKILKNVIKSWTSLGLTPKFHISEQNVAKRLGAHSDYVETIPDYFFGGLRTQSDEVLWTSGGFGEALDKVDIMIEAKMKEQATLKLMKKYSI